MSLSRGPDITRSIEEARRLLADRCAGDAVDLLQGLATRHPANASIWQALADCHQVLGDQAAELAACERALAIEPSDYRLRMRLADIHSRRGELAEAAAHYETVSEARPLGVKPALRLARACDEIGDARRAAAAWTRVAALQPHDSEARQRVAVLRSALRPQPSPGAQPRPVSKASRDDVKHLRRTARAHEETGDFETAEPIWRRLLELDPDDMDALERLALAQIIDGGVAGSPGKARRVIVLGNCQSYSMSACLRALSPEIRVAAVSWADVRSTAQIERLLTIVDDVEAVLVQPVNMRRVQRLSAGALKDRVGRCVQFPRIQFTGFHPDAVRVLGLSLNGLIGEWHSALILAGYRMGLPEERSGELFNAYIYGKLDYFDEYGRAASFLNSTIRTLGWELSTQIETWPRPFVYLPNHPRVEAMMDVARTASALLEIAVDPQAAPPPDPFLRFGHWPIYPEIGKRLTLAGQMQFGLPDQAAPMFDISEAVARSYAAYARSPPGAMVSSRVDEVIEILRSEGI